MVNALTLAKEIVLVKVRHQEVVLTRETIHPELVFVVRKAHRSLTEGGLRGPGQAGAIHPASTEQLGHALGMSDCRFDTLSCTTLGLAC